MRNLTIANLKSTLFLLLLYCVIVVQAEEPIVVSVNTHEPGLDIPDDALGLSYEISTILPNADGEYYFRADNEALVALFKTIGVSNLRIGGNSVDAVNIPLPREEDIRIF